MAAIAGRHAIAKPAASPAIRTTPTTLAMMRDLAVILAVILFVAVERLALLSTYPSPPPRAEVPITPC
jgi:hypothetical protein